MSKDIDIPADEHGHLRLFAVNLTPQEVTALEEGKPEKIGLMLGAGDLDTSFLELVQISDLEALGLTGYLHEGYGLSDAVLGPDRSKLNALAGHVLIVLSLAFRNKAVKIKARPDLTLIGSYVTDGPDWSGGLDIESKSAEPYSGPPPKKRPSDAAMSGRIATFALLFIFIFTAVFIWIAA